MNKSFNNEDDPRILRDILIKCDNFSSVLDYSMIKSQEKVDPEILLDLFVDTLERLNCVSKSIELDSCLLKRSTMSNDQNVLRTLDSHSKSLQTIRDSVVMVLKDFRKSSASAASIGNKLQTCETERRRIAMAQELLGYIKQLQEAPQSSLKQLDSLSGDELLEKLPFDLGAKKWDGVCKIIYKLNLILSDINCDDTVIAQKNLQFLSDIVESELLAQFEKNVKVLIRDIDDLATVKKAKDIADMLFLFNSGAHVQRRFIFGIVQHRFQLDLTSSAKAKQQQKRGRGAGAGRGLYSGSRSDISMDDSNGNGTRGGGGGRDRGHTWSSRLRSLSSGRYDGRGSEAEESEDEDEAEEECNYINMSDLVSVDEQQAQSVAMSPEDTNIHDYLLGLFLGIGSVCIDQSRIIALVFPPHTVDKLFKQLVLRVFNDPVFGLQAKIDEVVRPRPPRPSLSLEQYLEAVKTVRLKLDGLERILLKRSRGIAARRRDLMAYDSSQAVEPQEEDSEGGPPTYVDDDERVSESVGSGAGEEQGGDGKFGGDSLKPFLEEQISQLFHPYLADYFKKEYSLLKLRLAEGLPRVLQDSNLLQKGTGSALPRLRGDKVRIISQLQRVNGIASKEHVSSVLSAAEESVNRLVVVMRAEKKLPLQLKDVYILTQTFLLESCLLPAATVTRRLLIKTAFTYINASPSQAQAPISQDYILLLGLICEGMLSLKTLFEKSFLEPIRQVPNALVVCRDIRKKAVHETHEAVREAIQAWIWAQVCRVEQMLSSMQTKTDYRPKIDAVGSRTASAHFEETPGPSAACRAVCAVIEGLLKEASRLLVDVDLAKVVWKPLGELLVGALLSHIRRLKISPEGAMQLVLDLDEYRRAMEGPPSPHSPCPDPIDLLLSVREAAFVFMVPGESVVRVVAEDLRHLDASVLIALLAARSDFNGKNSTDWSRRLSASFPSLSVTGTLPWERNANLTTANFSRIPSGPSSLQQGMVMSHDRHRHNHADRAVNNLHTISSASALAAAQSNKNTANQPRSNLLFDAEIFLVGLSDLSKTAGADFGDEGDDEGGEGMSGYNSDTQSDAGSSASFLSDNRSDFSSFSSNHGSDYGQIASKKYDTNNKHKKGDEDVYNVIVEDKYYSEQFMRKLNASLDHSSSSISPASTSHKGSGTAQSDSMNSIGNFKSSRIAAGSHISAQNSPSTMSFSPLTRQQSGIGVSAGSSPSKAPLLGKKAVSIMSSTFFRG